jgi:hypothetical protein
MPASVFERLEEIYPTIIDMMPNDIFNTHEFMLKLVQEYQELYVQALIEYSQSNQPSLLLLGRIASRLKERSDLITYIKSDSIENVFEQRHDFEVWEKVRKRP